MTTEAQHIVCPHCGAINKVPSAKLSDSPSCGKCRQKLFVGKPAVLNASNYRRHIDRNDIPVVVDYWAPWCGPCLQMAPAFEAAAAELEPQLRLAKVDTQANPTIGEQANIRSIPTLAVFRGGKEIARQSGAMSQQQLVAWIRQATG